MEYRRAVWFIYNGFINRGFVSDTGTLVSVSCRRCVGVGYIYMDFQLNTGDKFARSERPGSELANPLNYILMACPPPPPPLPLMTSYHPVPDHSTGLYITSSVIPPRTVETSSKGPSGSLSAFRVPPVEQTETAHVQKTLRL